MERLKYNLENLDTLGNGEGGYPSFSVTDGTYTLDIMTNNSGNGLFYYDDRHGCINQTLGTDQFHLPRSKDAARRVLRQMFLEYREECIKDEELEKMISGMTYEELFA